MKKIKLYSYSILLLSWLWIFNVASEAQNFKCADLPQHDRLLRVAIIPDTQGDSNGEDGVAQKEIQGIKDHLLNNVGEIDFVLHVGDVTDAKVSGVPDTEQEQKILDELLLFNSLFTTPLAGEGIPFYPIVGNHDYRKRTPWTQAFPYLFDGSDHNGAFIDPETVPGSTPSSPYYRNYSYVVKHATSNTYFVLLDAFGGGGYYEWLKSRLQAIRAESPNARIFGIQHMPLFALAWHYPLDNIKDAGVNDTPEKFLELTKEYGVEGWFAGHNHYYHRAMLMDGDNSSSFDFTCGAASFKVYDRLERHPRDSHKVQITKTNKMSNGLFRANYMVMDVHRNFVVIKTYYADESSVDGSFKDFYSVDEYMYSAEGKQTMIAPMEAFTNIADAVSGSGYEGTSMAIIDGVNTDERTYTTIENGTAQQNNYHLNITNGWYTTGDWHTGKNADIVSDVLVLRGMTYAEDDRYTAPYTLTLSYDDTGLTQEQEEDLDLLSFMDYDLSDEDAGNWYKAVFGVLDGPTGGTRHIGPPQPDLKVGDYGVDTDQNIVWARLDCQGNFAVGTSALPMPDPILFKNEIIKLGDVWDYQVNSMDDQEQWNQRNYSSVLWPKGASPFGYGDAGLNTNTGAIERLFMRTSFRLDDPNGIKKAEFAIDYDDGYVLYVNGQEVDRQRIDDDPVTNTSWANAAINNAGSLTVRDLSSVLLPLLTEGENIIAMAVLNATSTSSDLSIFPELYLYSEGAPLPTPPDNESTYWLDECDFTTDWNSDGTLTLESSQHQQGAACLSFSGSSPDEFKKVFAPPHNVPLLPSTAKLQFWYYVSDVSQLQSTNQVELGSGGGPDVQEYNWKLMNLETGWNFIEISLAGASKTGGQPDLSNINWFRLYSFKSATVTAQIDGIRLVGDLATNINSANETKSLKVYPNPINTDIFTVEVPDDLQKRDMVLRIISIDGLILYTQKVKPDSSIELDSRMLSQDQLYIISLQSEKGVFNQRVLKR